MESDPNYAWHIDDQDKLKPFSFTVCEGIYEFSEKLIRLEVTL